MRLSVSRSKENDIRIEKSPMTEKPVMGEIFTYGKAYSASSTKSVTSLSARSATAFSAVSVVNIFLFVEGKARNNRKAYAVFPVCDFDSDLYKSKIENIRPNTPKILKKEIRTMMSFVSSSDQAFLMSN